MCSIDSTFYYQFFINKLKHFMLEFINDIQFIYINKIENLMFY